MSAVFATHSTAADLPAPWDGAADSLFQKREFLLHTEKFNPCGQRYVSATQDRSFAGAIVYDLSVNLLEFLHVRSPVRATVVGAPCSVSCGGLTGSKELWPALLARTASETTGLLLCLNLDTVDWHRDLIAGRTLPSVLMEDLPSSFDRYASTLRSDYRRHLRGDAATLEAMRVSARPCADFTGDLYTLYLQTLQHSVAPLETLSMDFFRSLPDAFRLTTLGVGDTVRCWHICVMDGKRLEFFLGGMDYRADDPRRTYRALLLSVLRTAIEFGAESLNLGQTAETSKLRLGGRLCEKTMLAWHPNRIARMALRLSRRILEYRTHVPVHRVTKGSA